MTAISIYEHGDSPYPRASEPAPEDVDWAVEVHGLTKRRDPGDTGSARVSPAPVRALG
jgi:hypothetical protein